MHFLKAHCWKLTLLGGAVAVASWLGWGYANQGRKTLVALDTTTGKLQWVYPLADDFGYSKGPIAGNGKVVLDGCVKTAEDNCGAYQIQTFDAQSGQLLWSRSTSRDRSPYNIASNQATLIQTNRLYVQLENDLHALDLKTGVQLWQTPRRWFSAPGVWYGMGIVAQPDKLAILNTLRNANSLQTLNPKTGNLQQSATIKLPKRSNTRNIIAANDRTLFLETSGLMPGDTPDSFYDSGTSTVMAYNSKTLEPRFRRDIQGGGIFQMNEIENILLLSNTSHYNGKGENRSEGGWLAMDADTGQILWQKKYSQLNCYPLRIGDPNIHDPIYLRCRRDHPDLGKKTNVMALSLQTGAVKWQTQLSTEGDYRDLPATVTDRQYLTFRRVKANTWQTQAVALDRQTGKLLWAFPLFDDEAGYVNTFRSIVAAEGDRFFTLDRLPRWQLWLLQINPNWYLKQPIAN
ncbi:PQQ-binding-like beta-propeller repeat protein [Chamaesiphon sp.]|uniref:outer membrane protein assembly factor BamB family protein n=1 Tax=Chamaesiphon sp. TaxID=2814140 RepID=UPI003593E771